MGKKKLNAVVHGSKLTQNHRLLRRQWALRHRRWRLNRWQTVMFTNESRFCIDSSDRRQCVYRRS